MKRVWLVLVVCLIVVLAVSGTALAKTGPATIQSGTILYSGTHYLAGEPLTVGYDAWGYNYQAHMFKGSYANAYLGGAGFPAYTGDDESYLAANPLAANHWAWPYRDVRIVMKWNDAWLANTDADGDGKLDRHYGFSSYIGSGAWETNHMWGDGYVDFYKIVAAPSDATKVGGVWYAADGTEIGADIWGEFAVIQEIYNDKLAGNYRYISPFGPGFGKF